MNLITKYTHWLHTQWPAGSVEKLPEVGENGVTSVPGLRIVGDLTGIPLLKFSLDTGARAVRAIVEESDFEPGGSSGESAGDDLVDLAIIGAGVAGISAAVEAKRQDLSLRVFEAAEEFSTVVNFPKGKPIYRYPTDMEPEGEFEVTADVKEDLLEELRRQRREHGIELTKTHVTRVEKDGDVFRIHHGEGDVTRARRVVLAIGRTGNYRKMDVPGEDLEKVYNRLYDPADFAGQKALVVGGGDSALETAIALVCAGVDVTLSYRRKGFSRPKPDNVQKIEQLQDDPSCQVQVERPSSDRVTTAASSSMQRGAQAGSLRLLMSSHVKEIREGEVEVELEDGSTETLENDVVLAMIGREAPLDFFRRSGIRLRGEYGKLSWGLLGTFTLFMLLVYIWKGWYIGHTDIFALGRDSDLGRSHLLGALFKSSSTPSFWFSLAYTAAIVGFGVARIRRRRMPYVTWQTVALMSIQVLPLFLLPEILLPWMDANGWLPESVRENLFPNGEYWRALGFILAWPLFLGNLASPQPMLWWVGIGLVQTFVIIPLIIWRWGKGAYCGWICSCGALAETMGDQHRHKMWHGPVANRWNMTGQVILVIATVITGIFMLSWIPGLQSFFGPLRGSSEKFYKIAVEAFIGGAIGVGFYFWFSGRVWCRFACPLAALMHVYHRFSRFRIFAEKKRCISCNVCTSVCHQGIDVMSFANKGLPMEDPQCVRCSACVQSCPTGVLQFGYLGRDGQPVYDRLPASPVLMRERSDGGGNEKDCTAARSSTASKTIEV